MKYLIIISLFFSFISVSYAQTGKIWRGDSWLRQYDLGTYHEGPYTMDVSGGTTGLVSLTAHKEPFQFENRTKLKVKVNSPASGNYLIKAEELSVENFYWFQTKPMRITASGATFDGWDVDRWLRRLNIQWRSLGLLAYYGAERNREFLPVWMYHSKLPAQTRYYIAQIRLGINIAKGGWRIYRGKSEDASRQVHNGNILEKSGGSCIPLRIPTTQLSHKGWYTVKVNLTEKSNLDLKTYTFYFYHE